MRALPVKGLSGAADAVVTTGRTWVSHALPRRRVASVTCAEVVAELPRILDDGLPAEVPLVSHVETCLRCQAELARYRRMVRLLHQLAATEVEPPPGVVADILSVVGSAAQRSMVRSVLNGRSLAYAGAVVAAGGAAAGLVAIARAHARHVVPAGAGAIVMVPGMLGAQPRGGRERPR
jgi:anti-sigma factor RsiW